VRKKTLNDSLLHHLMFYERPSDERHNSRSHNEVYLQPVVRWLLIIPAKTVMGFWKKHVKTYGNFCAQVRTL